MIRQDTERERFPSCLYEGAPERGTMESRNGLDNAELRRRRRQRLRRRRQQQLFRRTLLLIVLAFAAIFGLVSLAGSRRGDASREDQVQIITKTDTPAYARKEGEAAEVAEAEKEPAVQAAPDQEAEPEEPETSGQEQEKAAEEEKKEKKKEETKTEKAAQPERSADAEFFAEGYSPKSYKKTRPVNDEDIYSQYIVLIDAETNKIEAARNATTVMSPASMAKVLTVLVCCEQIEDLDKTVTMTMSANDYAYVTGSSAAGLEVGERVSARDMLYCTILPSGADAAVSLAEYVSGSHEAFAQEMNRKVKELGRDKTAHFTNAVGIYDEGLHCTVIDMAMIMKAALENKVCRDVLAAHTYTTSPTEEHPDGIFMSNLFLRRIEDYDDDFGVVQCAKTGYVDEAGSCAVSYTITNSGKHYICVTGNSNGSWNCIYDHCRIYERYAK